MSAYFNSGPKSRCPGLMLIGVWRRLGSLSGWLDLEGTGLEVEIHCDDFINRENEGEMTVDQ
jgi:hypothetical protein